MAKKTDKPTESKADYATVIIEKTCDELRLLLSRNWGNIGRILGAEQEITISSKLVITDRKATPGEQADKDNRIKVSISFAEKYSDNVEAPLPDPAQTEMDLGKPKEGE